MAISGIISGVGLASAKINGFFAIFRAMSALSTSGPDRPRKTSASAIASSSVRIGVSTA